MSNDKLRQGLTALDEISPFKAAVKEIERLNAALGQITMQNQRLRTVWSLEKRKRVQAEETIRTTSATAQTLRYENAKLTRENGALRTQRDDVVKASSEIKRAESARLSSNRPMNQSVPRETDTLTAFFESIRKMINEGDESWQ